MQDEWSEEPKLDDDGNPMMAIKFSAPAGMKDLKNEKFVKRVIELIREDEKVR